jgi:hypothetical protein
MLQSYQIYKVIKGNLKFIRTVASISAWHVKLNYGECVFGKKI